MPHQRAHHRQSHGLDMRLHRMRDVAEMAARAALLHRQEKRLLGGGQELARDRADRADREGAGRVGHPAVADHPHVDRQDVAATELVGPGDPVDDHRVRRGAERAGKAAVALERGLRALGADEPLGRLVELTGGDAGPNLAREQVQRPYQDGAGCRHPLDLFGRLLDDQARP